MTERVFRGRTEDAEAPFLGGEFWEEGKKATGVITRSFETANGVCFVLDLISPVVVDGQEEERVSVGNMAGFKMALQSAGLTALRVKDKLAITCTGKTPPKKEGNSPRVNFEVEVTRDV